MYPGKPSRKRRGALGLLIFAAICACPLGCNRGEPPDLVQVHRLSPGRASVGDRLTVTGDGFPEGRPATVTFRGDLARPGQPAETDVRISARATQAGRDAIVLPLDGELERRFVGRDDGPFHTTFHGEVRVTFEPRDRGLTGVTGVLRDVRFDVLRAGEDDASDVEPAPPTLAFLGIAAAPVAEGVGLLVGAVTPDGKAALAGIRAGDVLVDFDGATILGESDLRPRGGEQRALIIVERAGRPLPPLPVDVEGLAPLGPSDLARPAAALSVVVLLLLALASSLGTIARWASRSKDTVTRATSPSVGLGSATFAALVGPVTRSGPIGIASALVLALVVASLVRLATRHSLLGPDLDLATVAVSVTLGLVLARFVDGGRTSAGRWSLTRAAVALLWTLGVATPALLAIAGAVVANGRFVIGEMVAAQGASPWRWAATRNPGLLALALVLFAGTAFEAGGTAAFTMMGEDEDRLSRRVLRLAEWSYLWVMCATGSLLFLGGFRLPGVTSIAQEASRGLSLLGAALVVGKTSLVAVGIGAARASAARLFLEHVAPSWTRWTLPGSVAAAALATGFATAVEMPSLSGAADLSGVAVTAFSVTVALYIAFMTMRRGPDAANAGSVNPWL